METKEKKPKVKKDTWEYKDRYYHLLNDNSPLTFRINSKHSVRKPLMYFDEEKESYDKDHSLWLKFSLSVSTLIILIYFIFPSQLIDAVSKINII